MADIRLRIEVNGNNGTLDNITNISGIESLANVSFHTDNSNNFLNYLNPNKSGIEMLSWANNNKLTFTQNDILSIDGETPAYLTSENEPDMFVWGAVPQSKEYSVKLTLSGTNIKFVYFYGDKTANQFPTEAIIDGDMQNKIYSDDYQWAINFKEEANSHSIEFTKWNRANYNACLTLIRIFANVNIDKYTGLQSVSSLSQITSDAKSINYGVLPNSTESNIIDINGEIAELIDDGIIQNSNSPIDLYINNNRIQSHIATDSDYNIQNKTFSIQGTDVLDKWGKITYSGRALTEQTTAYQLLYEILYNELKYSYNQIQTMLSENIVYGNNNINSVEEYLKSINIPYPYLKSSNCLEAIDKICTLAQLNVLTDENGLPKFISARPVAIKEEINNALYLPKSIQITNLNKDIILKNKYDGIDMDETKVDEIIDYDTIINTTSWGVDLINQSISSDDKVVQRGPMDYKNPDDNKLYPIYAEIQLFYTNVTFKIPEYSNKNLEKILKAIDTKTNYNLIFEDDSQGKICPDDKNYDVIYYRYPSSVTEAGVTAQADNNETIGNEGTIFYEVNTSPFGTFNNYVPIFKVLTKRMGRVYYIKDGQEIPLKIENKIAKKLEMTFYGNKKTIEFSDISASSDNISLAKSIVNIVNNEILQENCKTNNEKISSIIKSNILNDYSNGISTGNVDIFCMDLYNSNGIRIKNFSNGEIINPYDIVYFDNDYNKDGEQRYWRVVGRTIKYNGYPYLSLELAEIHKIYGI